MTSKQLSWLKSPVKKSEKKNVKGHRRIKSSSEKDLYNIKSQKSNKNLNINESKKEPSYNFFSQNKINLNKIKKNEQNFFKINEEKYVLNQNEDENDFKENIYRKTLENKYSLIEEEDENLEGENKNSNGYLSNSKKSSLNTLKNKIEENHLNKNEILKSAQHLIKKNKPLVKHLKNRSSDLDNKVNFFLNKISNKKINTPIKSENNEEENDSKILKIEMEIKMLKEKNLKIELEIKKNSKDIQNFSNTQNIQINDFENRLKSIEDNNKNHKELSIKFEEFFNKIDFPINLRLILLKNFSIKFYFFLYLDFYFNKKSFYFNFIKFKKYNKLLY